jgi:fatty acid desaturase
MEIYKKMEPHQEPLWSIEILLFLLVSAVWVVGCTTSYPVVSVLSFAFSQGLISWIGHSTAHSRNKNLNVLGRIESALVGGLSLDWWSPKHNMHHMFTNIQKYDQDIQH